MNKLPDFFMERLYKEYNEEQANQIIEGYKLERKLTFRVNTIKTTAEEIEQRLVENEIMYKKVKWSKEAFIILNRNEDESLFEIEIGDTIFIDVPVSALQSVNGDE